MPEHPGRSASVNGLIKLPDPTFNAFKKQRVPIKRHFSTSEPEGPLLKSDVPTLIGVGVGLSIFTGLTCLVLKLFSRARFSQARAYGNAHLPPPALTSTGKL
jgi:hypothetical protein